MRRRIASLVLPLLLLGTAAFLGLAVIEEARLLGDAAAIETGIVTGADAATVADPDPQAPAPEFVPAAFATFREVLDRPIFSPTRRPPRRAVTVTAEAAPPPDPGPELELHGVVGMGSEEVALIAVGGAPSLRRVAVGDEIEGWHVEEIGAEGVLLRQGARTSRLRLDYGGAKP